MIGSEDNKVVRICFNSKKYDKSFDLTLPNSINSLKRLKDCILNNIKSQCSIDKIKIFNYKGIEIDEADIDYLGNGQLLFLSLDGSSFSILNYINEYETVKSIKSGGYGKVYLAKHVLTGKYVAIKQSNVTHLTNDEIYNISREAIYLESFKHKNIIRCYNSFSYESNFYMVMQYAEGGELGHYLEEKRWLTEKEVKQIISQIVDALLYIHLRSVIHRDLKPNNILFIDKERKNIAIIDFGISGYACGNVQEKVKAGTLKFVPPEVASGLSYTSSTKIDVWALGIILYFMLFGVYPFEGKEDMEISYKIVKEQFKLPTNIPVSKACLNLLKGMLEKNPQLRIELNNPLVDEWLNDNTKLLYKRKKQNLIEKDLDPIEEEKNSSIINLEKKDDNDNELINNYFKPNSKNNTSNLDLLTTELDEDVLREPAKFENTEEETISSFKYNSRPSLNNNSLKNKLDQLNLNNKPTKKNTAISTRGTMSLGSSNGLIGAKIRSSPKKSSSKLDSKESPVKRNFK